MSSHTLRVKGLQLHALEQGEGEAALLLHGWPTSSHLWRKMLPTLGQRYRAVAPDLPGFGRSDKPLDASYSFRYFDEVLEGIVDALKLEPVHLVVHDLGGPLGLYWAVKHPERLRSVTLLNTTVFPFDSLAVKLFLVATKIPLLNSYLASPSGVERAIRFGLSLNRHVAPEDMAPYTEPFQTRPARKALLKTAQNLHPKGFQEIVDGLQQLSCPIRLIYAEKDRILPDVGKEMERLSALLPEAKLSRLPGVGHFLQEDHPEPVSQWLLEFWDEVSASH